MDGQGTKRHRNIAENFNRLSKAHERYGQMTDRQTERRIADRWHIANVNLSSRSLKTLFMLSAPSHVTCLTSGCRRTLGLWWSNLLNEVQRETDRQRERHTERWTHITSVCVQQLWNIDLTWFIPRPRERIGLQLWNILDDVSCNQLSSQHVLCVYSSGSESSNLWVNPEKVSFKEC